MIMDDDFPTPPKAAADKRPSDVPGEPLKAEVSRTDSPGAGVSAAPPRTTPPAVAPKPANPAAAQTAALSEESSAGDQSSPPEDGSE